VVEVGLLVEGGIGAGVGGSGEVGATMGLLTEGGISAGVEGMVVGGMAEVEGTEDTEGIADAEGNPDAEVDGLIETEAGADLKQQDSEEV
jgi:hypothetical protein